MKLKKKYVSPSTEVYVLVNDNPLLAESRIESDSDSITVQDPAREERGGAGGWEWE